MSTYPIGAAPDAYRWALHMEIGVKKQRKTALKSQKNSGNIPPMLFTSPWNEGIIFLDDIGL